MRSRGHHKTGISEWPPAAAKAMLGGAWLVAALACAEPGWSQASGLRAGDCWYADLQRTKTEFRLCITAENVVEGVVIRRDALGPGVNEGWPVQARFQVVQDRLQIQAPSLPPNWLAADSDPSRTDGCAITFSRDGQRMTSSDCKLLATWCRHSPQELPPLCRDDERRGRQAPAGSGTSRRTGATRP
ncbi:hypothetical protein [Phreatobacter stygius]|uniref:Uncharacterized protein n=1 Tax=Phreatobacter stygius TaxID=1940610 RepID=A0A4D7B1A8_9HYPH|nr:hypothetical protein [Phreatobacter stygius]QCI63820.1 hypothetical protein E8M01_05910 [Phreatobacter stygius]